MVTSIPPSAPELANRFIWCPGEETSPPKQQTGRQAKCSLKIVDSRRHDAWDGIPDLPRAHCVTWGELCSLCPSLFPSLFKGIMITGLSVDVTEWMQAAMADT